MIDVAALPVFLVAVTLLTISPGVDTVLVIRNASRGGFHDGIVTTLGICSGLFLHATVSAVGISVILVQSAVLFTALKIAGAAYLVWLGATSLRRALSETEGLEIASDGERPFELLRSAREGLLSNVLNPKPIAFYMAFLPQFIDPAGSALAQSLVLALVHFVISVVWLGLVAAMVDRARGWLGSPRVKQALDSAIGGLLAVFGLGLAWEAVR